MIDILFYFGTEIIFVRVNGTSVTFGSSGFGQKMANIDGLKLDKAGVIKEFPDLKDARNWREEGIKRFKEHIKRLGKEDKIYEYVKEDLKKFGYIPFMMQKAGFRARRING